MFDSIFIRLGRVYTLGKLLFLPYFGRHDDSILIPFYTIIAIFENM